MRSLSSPERSLSGHNILFTTNVSPYWWRGIAADASVVFNRTSGVAVSAWVKTARRQV